MIPKPTSWGRAVLRAPWAAPLAWACLASGVTVAGCSVDALEADGAQATRNECNDDRDCGEGGICSGGQCRALQGRIEALLVEVIPPADAAGIAGVSFVQALGGLDPRGGELSLDLGHVARVQGVVVGAVSEGSCAPETSAGGAPSSEDGSLPARITLRPRQRQLGISAPNHTSDAAEVEGAYRFTTAVPPGRYDIYVEPRSVVGQCAQPPHLFRDQLVEAGDVSLGLNLVVPEELQVVVRWPGETPELDGWTLDVIDGDTGSLVSTRGILAGAQQSATGYEYFVSVAYVPVQGVDDVGVELVRLSPPAGVAAPQVIIDRSVVELFVKGQGVIDQLQSLPRSVQVIGQVSVENSTTAVPATVSLVATELRMITGTVASFERMVDTDASGQFSVDLLPGTYRVVAFPPVGSGLSPTEAVWQISAHQDVQAGRVVEVGRSATIGGRVLGPGRGVVAGAAVQAAASVLLGSSGVLDNALGRVSYSPRADGVVTDGEGRFTMTADRGRFDLWVRPGSSSGFAWLVRPGVDATSEALLGNVRLPLPVRYSGVVSSADLGSGVAAALVRAYAYLNGAELTNDAGEATSAIQVAESRVGSDGTFQLLLPAQLSAP